VYIPEGQVTFETLQTIGENLEPGLDDDAYPILLPNDGILPGMYNVDVPMLADVRLRVIDHKNVWEIRYLFLEAENGPFDLVWNLFELGEHRGDLEHITARVNADTGEFISIFYACHSYDEGAWMPPESLDFFNGTHPIVYSAHYSHASYPTCGTMRRKGWFGFFPHDHCDAKGMIWFPSNIIPMMTDPIYWPLNVNNTFYRYLGYWGSTHTGGAQLQRWWPEEW